MWLWLVIGAVLSLDIAIYSKMMTGNTFLDRFEIRGRIAFWGLYYFKELMVQDPSIWRALMAIVHKESGGNPVNYLGDVDAPGGPSIGPMQVYRQTAIDYGLFLPILNETPAAQRDRYAALRFDENLMIRWGVQVFYTKYREQHGNVFEALRAYNGSGPQAIAYRDSALLWIAQTYGSV